jgi:hypothetical protein
MESLRKYIGAHKGRLVGELYQRELTSLILRAGRVAGLDVRTEIKVLTGAMDCGWYAPGSASLIVAWEFDGRDVGNAHISGTGKRLGNAKKFAACGAKSKIQVLYALRNDLAYFNKSRADRVATLLGADVEIVTDEQLMAPSGIEAIIDRARRLAGLEP